MSEIPLLSSDWPEPLAPSRYSLPMPLEELRIITPAAVPNAVAAVGLDEKLYRWEFAAGEVRATEVDREYVEQVAGGLFHAFGPALLPGETAYLQSRRIVLYQLQSRMVREYRVAGLNELAMEAGWVTAKPQQVAVLLKDTSKYGQGRRLDWRLRTFELGLNGVKRQGVLELGTRPTPDFAWSAGHGRVALVKEDGRVALFDAGLKPVVSPLVAAITAMLQDSRRVVSVRMHPREELLVLGVVERDDAGRSHHLLWRASMEEGSPRVVPLARFPTLESLTVGPFSPTGEYVCYAADLGPRMRLFVQKVTGTPGAPLALGAVESPRLIDWAREPLALIAVDEEPEALLHWNLEKLPAAKGKSP
ncbi:hypothetical protein ACLESO_38710 [Pyxidicoccus sp. 3LG]